MYKTEKLYVIYEDDSGHRHLIPKEYYNAFDKSLNRIGEAYDEHGDEDIQVLAKLSIAISSQRYVQIVAQKV